MNNIMLYVLPSKSLIQFHLTDHQPVTFPAIKSKSISYRDVFSLKSLKFCFACRLFLKIFSPFPHIPIRKKLALTKKTSYNTPMKKPMHIERLFRQPCAIIYQNFRFEETFPSYYSYLLYKGMSLYFYPLNVDISHVYAFSPSTHSKGGKYDLCN